MVTKKILALGAVLLFIAVPLAVAQEIDSCEGNFDCDSDVDGSDAFVFKSDFGRTQLSNPCPASSSCCSGTLSPLGRWCDQNNGTVKDMTTGLVWLKDAGWGGQRPWADCTTWDDAHTRAGTLQSGLAGLSDGSVEGDWRLPTMSELEGITRGDEYIQYDQPHFFANGQSFFYWSSTACPGDIEHAWLVFMYCGCLGPGVKSYNYFVWPVRGGR